MEYLYPHLPSVTMEKKAIEDLRRLDRHWTSVVRNVCVHREEGVNGSPVYLLSGVPKHSFIGQWLHH